MPLVPMVPHVFCHFCGIRYHTQIWPRTCDNCQQQVWQQNPIPVVAVIIPIDNGVLLIRRGVAPKIGELAFPGGYVDHNEDWKEAAIREVREEVGITIDDVVLLTAHSSPTNKLVLFCLAPAMIKAEFDKISWQPNLEVQERVIVYDPVELAFPLHTKMLAEAFKTLAVFKELFEIEE